MRACLGDTTRLNILDGKSSAVCPPPSLLPGLGSKRSEWMGGLPSAMTHLYAGGGGWCFSSVIPRSSPFIPRATISRLLFLFIWFLQVSLLPLSPSFASSPPLPPDVCPSPPPSAFDAVFSLKVKIASVSFSCRFCLLTSAGMWSNKQRGGNTTVRSGGPVSRQNSLCNGAC